MQRPLENLPPLDPAHRQALDGQLATRWFENPVRALKIGFRRVSQLPLHYTPQHTQHPALIFRDRDQALRALGIDRDNAALLPSETIRHYPPRAPMIDDSPYFAQWAAAWEPLLDASPVPIKYERTLIVEIGAGFYLLSLAFTPDRRHDDPQALQLDRLCVRQGHDVFDLPLALTGDRQADARNIQRARALIRTARQAVTAIHDDYPLAETVLSEGLRPIIEQWRLQSALDGAIPVPRPHGNKQTPLRDGPHSLPSPQEP